MGVIALVRLTLSANTPPSVPRKIVAKFSPQGKAPLPRFMIRAVFKAEAHFYNDFTVADGGISRPECYLAMHDVQRRKPTFCMLLEDMMPAIGHDRIRSTSDLSKLQKAVACLARLHARWWGHAKAPPLEWALHPSQDFGGLVLNGFVHTVKTGFNALAKIYPQTYAPIAGWLPTLRRRHKYIMAELFKPPLTLCHGDAHLENVFFDERFAVRTHIRRAYPVSNNAPVVGLIAPRGTPTCLPLRSALRPTARVSERVAAQTGRRCAHRLWQYDVQPGDERRAWPRLDPSVCSSRSSVGRALSFLSSPLGVCARECVLVWRRWLSFFATRSSRPSAATSRTPSFATTTPCARCSHATLSLALPRIGNRARGLAAGCVRTASRTTRGSARGASTHVGTRSLPPACRPPAVRSQTAHVTLPRCGAGTASTHGAPSFRSLPWAHPSHSSTRTVQGSLLPNQPRRMRSCASCTRSSTSDGAFCLAARH
jgi:hypothetical protein